MELGRRSSASLGKMWLVSAGALLLLCILLLNPAKGGLPAFSVGKDAYALGEEVSISISVPLGQVEVYLAYEGKTYRYSGPQGDVISFRPSAPGNYTLILRDTSDGSLYSDSFAVLPSGGSVVLSASSQPVEVAPAPQQEDIPASLPGGALVQRDSYAVGETVLILCSGAEEVRILHGEELFVSACAGETSLSFIPKEAGLYVVEAASGGTLSSAGFTVSGEASVSGAYPVESASPAVSVSAQQESVQASPSREDSALVSSLRMRKQGSAVGLEVRDGSGRDVAVALYVGDEPLLSRLPLVGRLAADRRDVLVEPSGHPVKRLVFSRLDLTAPVSLGLSSSGPLAEHGRQFSRVYALDPSQLSFESATFTATASGRALYKCRNWSFAEERCRGDWTRVRSLTPGEDYTVELTPDDPGFAETGITTVNSLKPIYRPGETAELLIGVVDTEGHLISDATVDLLVTDPDGTTTPYSTTLGTVVNASPGVYRAFHPVALEGRHNLTVSALAPAVNHSMSASFESRSFFEFDILRDSPIVIDPMAADVSTNFTLVSFVDASDITLTESLPPNFTVLDAGGAEVSSAEGRTLLTWTGLGNGTRVGYVADIPVIMPELYELGPVVVEYAEAGGPGRRTFEEARVWYLTADAITVTDTSVTTNRSVVPEGQQTHVSATFLCSGTGNLDFTFYLRDDGTVVDTTSAGRDFYCPSSAGVTCAHNGGGGSSCTVNANCSISVDKCANNQRPNATWTLTASANAEALPSINNITVGASSGTMNDSTEVNISDDTPPRWSGLMMSPSPAYQSNAVKFNASWLDDYGLGWYIFAVNEGSWQNQTPAAFSGATAAESNYTYQVTSEAGTFVYWRFFANDSLNNQNSTDTMNFTVGGVVWNQSSLSIPTAGIGDPVPNASVRIEVYHQNTGINVTCTSGSCTTIYSNFTNGATYNNTNVSVLFNCSTAAVGSFTANFSLVSTQDSAPSNITVSCTIILSDPPVGTNPMATPSIVFEGGTVKFNATWSDDNGLSRYIFSINESGWSNQTALTFNPATNESNYTYALTAAAGTTIQWTFFANDSDNQFSSLGPQNLTVGGVRWNQSFFNLGTAEQLTADLTGVALIEAFNQNANVQVACLSGNCSTLSHNFTNGSTLAGSSSTSVQFTCDTDIVGDFSALFSVVSANDTTPNNITINCTITASTDTSPPNVTIHRPPSSSRQYNYTDSTNNSAWEGGNISQPPVGIQYGTAAEAADYTAVSTSDDSRWTSSVSSSGLHAYQSYRFAVPTDTQDLVSITLTHEGYALRQLGDNADSSYLYVWNYTSSSYSLIATKASSSSDITSTVTFSVDFSSIIGSGNYLYILFEGNFNTTVGQPQARVLTDYISLDVVARTVISGQYPVNATVTDSSVVSWVSYRLINDTSTATLGSWTGMTQTVGSDVWYNTTDTTAFADGLYTFLVNASDAVGNLNGTVSVRVRILNAYPTVTLNNPANNTNWTQANITLNWTPTISAGGDLLCDVYVNGTKNNTAQITVANGTFGTWNLTSLRDGSYRWQVNCTQGSLTNSSETWVFKIDANSPAITPTYPPDGFWNISDNLTVLYNVSDYSALSNCSLVLNGVTNQTNTTSQIVNGGQNFFNLTSLGQRAYNWSINCSDEYNQSNTSVSRLFSIDWTAPGITLLGPPSGSPLNGTSVTFNFTPTDNLAGTLTCNLTIDDTVRDAGFSATNDSITTRTVSPLLDGLHWWNVTCWDYAGNTNTSATWNFTIFGGPAVTLLSPENYTANASTSIVFLYNASDTDGVQNCTLAINNIINSTAYFPNITNFGVSNFSVIGFPEGRYDWSINCTDNVSREGASDTYTLFIDLTEPGITLLNPQNAVTFTTDDIQFNYTAFENTPLNMTCLLALDGTVEDTRSVANNSLVTLDINNVGDGNHTWYVNCTDSVARSNSSATWWFMADGPPNVYLDSPANDTGDPDGNVTFFYNISDFVGVDSCSLILNNIVNQTSYNNKTMNYTGTGTSGTVTASERDKWLAQDGSYGQFTVSSEQYGTVENFTTGSGTIGTVEVCWRYYTEGTWTDDYVNLQWFVDGGSATSAFNVTAVVGNSTHPVTNCSDISASLPGLNWGNVSALNLRATGVKTGGADGGDFFGDVFLVSVRSDDANLTNNGKNNFTLRGMSQAVYNWTVNCTDISNNRGGASPAWVLYVDFTKPGISLTFPANGSTVSDDPMNYTFTATDNLAQTFFCNLTRDGAINISLINATSGQAIVLNVTRPDDGNHNWNVTCWDKAFNTNTSETFTFTTSSVPDVELLAPPSGSAETDDGSVNFTFYLSAVNNISNCTIWFNGVANSTKNASELANEDTNNFTLSGLGESYLYWNITCTDVLDLTGNSSTWLLIVDFSPPGINLTYPGNGDIITNTSIAFNFTPYDTLDPTLNCTLFINGIANESFINATEGQPALVNVTDFDAGQYAWNVTCQDDALWTNYSETRTFTVAQAPLVTLVYPANGSGETDGNITFLFNASSRGATNLTRCDILLDDIINGTKNQSQLANGSQNNFTVAGIPEGNHTWTANCTDSNNVSTIATPWLFYVDSTFPWVALNSPADGESISQEGVTFNWTAYDLVTHTLVCNVTIYNNTLLNRTLENILSPNSTPVTSTANFTGEGWYQWNVTCWDAVGNWNVSETRQFYINFSPSVTLVSPPDNSFTNNSFVNFTYLPEDNTGFGVCYLHINRTLYDSTGSVTEGVVNGFYETGFGEGNITWMVNCTDDDGNRVEAPDWRLTFDFTKPSIRLSWPEQNMTLNTSTVANFTFNASDNLVPTLNCTVRLDNSDVINLTALNGTPTITTSVFGLNDSIHWWNVTCTDNATNWNTSETWNFTVNEKPEVSLAAPANGTRTNLVDWNFSYIPTDNSGLIANCSLIIDGVINQTNTSVAEGVVNNFTVTGFQNGIRNWTVNCTDPSGNWGYNETRALIIDLEGPSITLNYPPEASFVSTENITFNFTPTDAFGVNLTCNLTILNLVNVTLINTTSGNHTLVRVDRFASGDYNWSVTCWDDLNNTNMSGTSNFTVNAPDLNISSDRITFNDTNPDYDSTITIFANVSNDGAIPASAIQVEFWDGNPDAGGTQINGNQTIASLADGTFAVVNVSWTITLGYHQVYVLVDPDNNITETTDDNNNASRVITTLYANITYPPNNTISGNATVQINFTAADFLNSTLNWSIFVDGALESQNGTVFDGNWTVVNITFSGGKRCAQVQAADPYGRWKNSTAWCIRIDLLAPNITFVTQNGSWFGNGTPTFFFNITDDFDALINFSMFVNGTIDFNGTAPNNTITNATISDRGNGTWLLVIQAWDDVNNTANSSSLWFYIDTVPPEPVILTANRTWFGTGSPVIAFNISDNLAWSINYTLYVDGINNTRGTMTNSVNTTAALSGLTNGTWTLTLEGTDMAANAANGTSITIYVDTVNPVSTINAPPNDTYINDSTPEINFTLTDNMDSPINYTVYVDGAANGQTGQAANGSSTLLNLSALAEGTHTVLVQATDEAANAANNTPPLVIHIDLTPPIVSIVTANGTWFNTATPLIQFNASDNVSLLLNFSFTVNGSADTNGTAVRNNISEAALQAHANGTWLVTVTVEDRVGFTANSSAIVIYIDTVQPSILLNSPGNGENFSTSTVTFNWTPSDNLDWNLSCNLTVDSIVNSSLSGLQSGVPTNLTLTEVGTGLHWWNITCWDHALNTNTSETRWFNITMPDLEINAGNITLNTSSVRENESVTISATVFNLDRGTATNVTVEFWNGIPGQGTQINGNLTIASLAYGGNATVNVSYAFPIGTTAVYVIVDRQNLIPESSESNNNASLNVTVSAYHLVLGNATGELRSFDFENLTLYAWQKENVSGSNIFVVDTDSSLTWTALRAIGRNLSENETFDDFAEIDTALAMTALNDSINRTWTLGNAPLETVNLTIYGAIVPWVPVINSTNTSNFRTGILWDSSDANPGQFNASQDLVFITVVQSQLTGLYGVYDYELNIPARLRQYVVPNNDNSVSFYTELK